NLSKTNEKSVACQNELTKRQDDYRRLNAGHNIPSPDQLFESRTGRDQTWQQIKKSLLAEEQKQAENDPAQVAHQFEQEMQDADSIADQRQKALKVIIQIEELLLDIESREKQLEALTQSESDAKRALSAIVAQWKSLWQATGIEPQSPIVMQQWASLYRSYLNECQLESSHRTKRDELFDAINDFRHKSTSVLGDATAEDETDANLIRRLDEALENARQAIISRGQLQKQVKEAKSKLERLKKDQENNSHKLDQVIDNANMILQQIPSFQSNNLEIANTIISEINIVKSQLASADKLKKRIDAMQGDLSQYESDLQETANRCDEPIGDNSVEESALELRQKFEEAKDLVQAQTKLNDQIKRESKQLETLTKQLTACSDQLIQWNKAAKVQNASEFRQVSEQAKLRKTYETELRTSQRDLALIREGIDETAFRAELESTDKHALELENSEFANQLNDLDEQIKLTDQAIGALRDKINKSDQSSDTIKISTEIESLQAEITNHVDQYVPLVFAQQMIEKAILRFRQKNEGEILESINQLFSELTLGRYRGIDRNHDSTESLVAIDHAGQEKLAAELSTGTREQLYLAIRLAYIKHYADKSEPLPVVMDDILVNFDDERQLSTLKVLMNFDPDIQILFLTCHESVVHKAQSINENVPLVSLLGDPNPPKPVKKKRKQSKPDEPTLF
ncbi:MAG: ATP-binding protein, partial [Pirellulales bacterium]